MFSNKEDHGQTWSKKTANYITNVHPGPEEVLELVMDQDAPIATVLSDNTYGDGAGDLDEVGGIHQMVKDFFTAFNSQTAKALI